MNCPKCWHQMVQGMTSKGHNPIRVCTHCNKVWVVDEKRGGLKEKKLREVA